MRRARRSPLVCRRSRSSRRAPARATASSGRAPTAFVLTGGGWGHGVGMSQWGAYGYAKHGRDLRPDPRALLPGDDARPGARRRRRSRSACSSPTRSPVGRRDSSPGPFRLVDGRGRRAHGSSRHAARSTRSSRSATPATRRRSRSPGPLTLPAGGRAASRRRRAGVPRHAPHRRRAAGSSGRQRRRRSSRTCAASSPARCRRTGRSRRSRRRRSPPARTRSRTSSRAGRFDLYSDTREPGLRRDRRGTVGDAGGAGDERQVLLYGGKLAHDVLLLERRVAPRRARRLRPATCRTSSRSTTRTTRSRRTTPGAAVARGAAASRSRSGCRGRCGRARTSRGATGTPAALVLTTTAGATTELRLSDVRSRLGLKSLDSRSACSRSRGPPARSRRRERCALSGVARDVDGRRSLEQRSPGGWTGCRRPRSRHARTAPSPLAIAARPRRHA